MIGIISGSISESKLFIIKFKFEIVWRVMNIIHIQSN